MADVVNSSLKFGLHEDENSELYEYYLNISRDNLLKMQEPFITIVTVIYILLFLTCILGIVGNGTIIWLLAFGMKRTPFTTYILNLAIADIGVLIVSILTYICAVYEFVIAVLNREAVSLLKYYIFGYVLSLLYNTDQLLLTAISVDRCVVVLFPVWHRCHRQPHLSRTVCVFIWVLSFLLSGLDILLIFANQFTLLQFMVNVVICTPLMAISAITLLVTICLKSQQRKRGKLFMTIFLALSFFLIFGFPVNYMSVLIYYYVLDDIDITIPILVAFACTVLNCSVNPLIYFLVGRDKKSRSGLSMKVALQRVFKDEENCRGEEGPLAETQV
ncbi:mas-related G-protein coupled receptor member H-like [Sphaerodactylus townsendi]|uniref:mas-related G-protein coupled receptor member H-like n=1 Tax=Sphaerodactylus townsendi TaxID=933632 RepID=UPI002026F457|nr:mas-related G-protein coupled receptor member H-like [Sphaerodactylus townsendi]